jgi:hypothetical protein
MTPEEAVAILQDTFSTPLDNLAVAPRVVRLAVGAPQPDGKATASLTTFHDGQVWEVKEEDLPVLPEVGWEQIEAGAYKAFALGVRVAANACDLSIILPSELVRVNLLRIPRLRTAEEVAEAILNRDARRRALAALEVDDYGREHDLPLLSDATIQARLWLLMGDAEAEEAEAVARSLRDEHRTEAIPYLLCLLEDRQERMWHTGGISWVSGDGRNIDVVLARILEPLLRGGASPSERGRLEALEVMGMFDEDHETATYEWMCKT